MASTSLMQIEKLDEKNFDSWKIQMKSALICNDLWKYIQNEKPKSDEKGEWSAGDEKALAMIMLSIKSTQILHVKKATSSKEAWEILEKIHQPSGPGRKVSLFKRLLQLKMSENGTMSDHLHEFFDVVEKLCELDIEIDDDLISIILLCSLPTSYENFVVAIESRDNLPSPNVLKTKLLEEEGRRKTDEKCFENGEQVFLSKAKHNNRQKVQMYRPVKDKYKRKGECYVCRKRGHYASECRQRSSKEENKSNVAFFSSVNMAVSDIGTEQWILDSGSTSHMCREKSSFINLKPYNERIELAGNYFLEANGIGDVQIETYKTILTLKDVLYVPTLKSNFISVSKATKTGCTIEFAQGSAVVKRRGKAILKVNKIGNLYIYTSKRESCLLSSEQHKSDLVLWHKRYGHLNSTSLKMLYENSLVRGFKLKGSSSFEGIGECEVCAKGKICVKPFPKYTNKRSANVLDLVHSDVCGPMRNVSIGGARYFVSFIDDHSRRIFVYFIKEKSEVFSMFKEFKAQLENETGKRIKILRTDNGREYLSSEMQKFLKENGINHQLTAEYTPQQNGIAERTNRTIVEMARCMIIDANLKENFWAEAINTAVYLRNRSPSKPLSNITPYEAWYGIKPTVSHLRTFGTKAIMLNKRTKSSKFQAKGIECVFVGYCDNAKAYRLYETKTRRIHKSRDVIFLEHQQMESKNTESIADITLNNEEIIETTTDSSEEQNTSENSINEDLFEDAITGEDRKCEKAEIENEIKIQQDKKLEIQDEDETQGNEETETQNGNTCIEDQEQNNRNKGGRPRIIRTEKPGRPRKVSNSHNSLNVLQEKPEYYSNSPLTVTEALSRKDNEKWKEAMKVEYEALMLNNTWELVDLPDGRRPIKCKWVFNVKRNADGSVNRYKARLVAKGCNQIPNVDYKDTFSPVAKYTTIRCVLALAVEYGLLVHQMDVVTAFLNGDLKEEIFMEQPEYFTDMKNKQKVCKLNKALYGLKQSGREWNEKLDKVLKKMGFNKCTSDNCVYVRNKSDELNIIVVYVDDILIACSNAKGMNKIKNELSVYFNILDKGQIDQFLGMEIYREGEKGSISISQKQLIINLLESENMSNCRKCYTPIDPGQILRKCENCENCEKVDKTKYQSITGSLMYLGIISRPDILHSVVKLSQFNQDPHMEHLKAIKHILRYLKTTINLKLCFRKTGEKLMGFADADWAGCSDGRKSFTACKSNLR